MLLCVSVDEQGKRVQKCGCSSMVESQPSKLVAWVRFPSPAPQKTKFALVDERK